MGTVTFETLASAHHTMKLFIAILLVAIALAEAKKGGKGKKPQEFTEEMAMACLAGTAMEEKIVNATAQCFDDSILTAAGRKGKGKGKGKGKKKCKKVDAIVAKYTNMTEARMCMEASMGWIDATGQPIVDVIIEDISSLDQTVTNVYNYDSVTKCMKKSLKKAAKCGHDPEDLQVQGVAYYFCTDMLVAKGCSKFLSTTQAGK